MSQAGIQNLMDHLNGEYGASALADWGNWTFPDLNLLLQHSMQCSGCNRYCETMKSYWKHQCNCNMPHSLKDCQKCRNFYDIFRFHVKCCTKEDCEILRCSEIRTTRKISIAEIEYLRNKIKTYELPAIHFN